jgi:hypothetical protein
MEDSMNEMHVKWLSIGALMVAASACGGETADSGEEAQANTPAGENVGQAEQAIGTFLTPSFRVLTGAPGLADYMKPVGITDNGNNLAVLGNTGPSAAKMGWWRDGALAQYQMITDPNNPSGSNEVRGISKRGNILVGRSTTVKPAYWRQSLNSGAGGWVELPQPWTTAVDPSNPPTAYDADYSGATIVGFTTLLDPSNGTRTMDQVVVWTGSATSSTPYTATRLPVVPNPMPSPASPHGRTANFPRAISRDGLYVAGKATCAMPTTPVTYGDCAVLWSRPSSTSTTWTAEVLKNSAGQVFTGTGESLTVSGGTVYVTGRSVQGSPMWRWSKSSTGTTSFKTLGSCLSGSAVSNAVISGDAKTVVAAMQSYTGPDAGIQRSCVWTAAGATSAGTMYSLKAYIERPAPDGLGAGATSSLGNSNIPNAMVMSADGKVIAGGGIGLGSGNRGWVVKLPGHCELDWDGNRTVTIKDAGNDTSTSPPTVTSGSFYQALTYYTTHSLASYNANFPEVSAAWLDWNKATPAGISATDYDGGGTVNPPVESSSGFLTELNYYTAASTSQAMFAAAFPHSQCSK